MKTLPQRLTMQRARGLRLEALSSLTRDEFRLVECVFADGGRVFGNMKGEGAVLLSKFVKAVPPKRKGLERDERMDHGGALVARLVRCGWLRFGVGPSGDCGFFWPTDSARTLWKVLAEKATDTEFQRRCTEDKF